MNTYVEDFSGDVFASINQWAKDANSVTSRTYDRIGHNEALSSCLTQQLPENLHKRRRVKDMEHLYVERYVREAISQIDDPAVRYSVLTTINASRAEKNLVFKYHDNLTKAQKARVRVISKLVWYNLYPKENKNYG